MTVINDEDQFKDLMVMLAVLFDDGQIQLKNLLLPVARPRGVPGRIRQKFLTSMLGGHPLCSCDPPGRRCRSESLRCTSQDTETIK